MTDLFARARAHDPVTSHLAAAKVPAFENTHYAKIIAFLDGIHPYSATYEKIATETELDKTAVGRRMGELERLGKVRRAGYGTLANGNRAQTWQIA